MAEGIILSIFDEKTGFIPIEYHPSSTALTLIKKIIFRTTLNLVGGTKNLKEDRESFLDFPENQIIGCSHLKSIPSTLIRGGSMPIIIILFSSVKYRPYIYNNILEIMDLLKKLMIEIIPYLEESKFRTHKKLKSSLIKYFKLIKKDFSESLLDPSKGVKDFTIQCPECSQKVEVKVPIKIPEFLTIPVTNASCGHLFDAYFTKGPNFRGTSEIKNIKEAENDLKDIFNNL